MIIVASPDPKNFIYDATKGYFHDSTTGFFYDRNSDYYYNPNSNKVYIFYFIFQDLTSSESFQSLQKWIDDVAKFAVPNVAKILVGWYFFGFVNF